jgi:hypothetical protein
MICCVDFIQTCQTSSVTTVDKFWAYQYSHDTKFHDMEWRTEASLRPRTFCLQKLRIKMMLITFFDTRLCSTKNLHLEEKQ